MHLRCFQDSVQGVCFVMRLSTSLLVFGCFQGIGFRVRQLAAHDWQFSSMCSFVGLAWRNVMRVDIQIEGSHSHRLAVST